MSELSPHGASAPRVVVRPGEDPADWEGHALSLAEVLVARGREGVEVEVRGSAASPGGRDLATGGLSVADVERLAEAAARLRRARVRARGPLLARMSGVVAAPLFTLALSADLLLVDEGMVGYLLRWQDRPLPLPGDLPALADRLGRASALEVALTGRPVSGEELVAAGQALGGEGGETAWGAARQASPVARAAASGLLARQGLDRSAAEALERAVFALCFAGADREEGMSAFLEKRPPRFEGEVGRDHEV